MKKGGVADAKNLLRTCTQFPLTHILKFVISGIIPSFTFSMVIVCYAFEELQIKELQIINN